MAKKTIDNEKVVELKTKLEKLTKLMDVPCYHYSNVKWLLKNLKKRNATHPSYKEASAIVEELQKMGAQ